MARLRFDESRPSRPKTTVGDVLAGLSADAAMAARLGDVYQKVFVLGGVRNEGSRIVVSASLARAEINEIWAWVVRKYGEPFGTVGRMEAFGYNSVPKDYWTLYFAALGYKGDESLERDFAEKVAGLSWASYSSSARMGGVAGGGQAPAAKAAAPSVRIPKSYIDVEGAEKKLGWTERVEGWLGLKPEKPVTVPVAAPVPVPRPREAVPAPSEEGEDLSEEEAAAADRAFRARAEAEAEKAVLREVVERNRRFREDQLNRLEKPEQYYEFTGGKANVPGKTYAKPGYGEPESESQRRKRLAREETKRRKLAEEAKDKAEAEAARDSIPMGDIGVARV